MYNCRWSHCKKNYIKKGSFGISGWLYFLFQNKLQMFYKSEMTIQQKHGLIYHHDITMQLIQLYPSNNTILMELGGKRYLKTRWVLNEWTFPMNWIELNHWDRLIFITSLSSRPFYGDGSLSGVGMHSPYKHNTVSSLIIDDVHLLCRETQRLGVTNDCFEYWNFNHLLNEYECVDCRLYLCCVWIVFLVV